MDYHQDHPGRVWRNFTREELEDIGLIQKGSWGGYVYPEDIDIVVDVEETSDSHGTAMLVTWKVGDTYWQQVFGYNHEDWGGTSDLYDYPVIPAWQVAPCEVKVTRYAPCSASAMGTFVTDAWREKHLPIGETEDE